MLDFNKRLRDIRVDTGQTQKHVAKKIAISENAYSDLENKKCNPSVDTLIKLCKYFNVSSDYLLGISDEQTYLKAN